MAQKNRRELEGTGAQAHDAGTRKGEEMAKSHGREPGRQQHSGQSGAGRPSGGSTARDSTGINPEDREPIDSRMPHMPPA